jgi:outer membrane lipoprotein LolB
MTPVALRLLRALIAVAIFFVAGCAHTTRAGGPLASDTPRWQGRLALTIHSAPLQAFSADFELVGTAEAGWLVFYSPLGTTVARLQWNADGAELQSTGQPQHFDTLDALTQQTTGAALPITNLFAWLRGEPSEPPGWQVDLSRMMEGHLQARRFAPEPIADLRIVLER